jgi:hypothetical protein
LLEHLWRHLSFGVTLRSDESDVIARQLLALSRRVDVAQLSERDANEVSSRHLVLGARLNSYQIAMFHAIERNEGSTLLHLGHRLEISGAKPASLLCLDHVFRVTHKLATAGDTEVSNYLRQFYTYLQHLRTIATEHGVHERAGVRRLFGLVFSEDDGTYLALAGTYLHQFISDKAWSVLRTSEEGVHLSSPQVSSYLSRAILERIDIRVKHHEAACGSMRAFEPCCLSHAVFAQCHSPGCSRQHVDVKKVTKEWFSHRVGIHLQHIMILQVCMTPACMSYFLLTFCA